MGESSNKINTAANDWEAMATVGVRKWRHAAGGDAWVGASQRLATRSLQLSYASAR